MCIFNAFKMQSGIGFIVDTLFGNFAYLHNLYTVVELHINFVLIHFGSQPYSSEKKCNTVSYDIQSRLGTYNVIQFH